MKSRTKPNERVITRICAVISACIVIGLSSGAAFAAPLESAGSPSTAPAAPQGAKTAAIKAAIKVVVKTLRKAGAAAMLTKEGASSFIGRLAARHAATIATRLEVLLTYETLVLDTIKDQVKNALVGVGVAGTTATTVGFYVKLAVEAAL